MPRPKKIVSENPPIEAPKERKHRIDPTPFKVYYKHFVSNLSLGCILNGKDVVSVFMCDSVTHNYSDVTEIDALKAASKKMFKSRDNQGFLVATFCTQEHAARFIDGYMDTMSQTVIEQATQTSEPATE